MTDKERLMEIIEKAGYLSQYPGTMARILIENGVTFATNNNVGSKWISVTERLPDEWMPVLVWSWCGFCEVAVYLGIPGKWRVTWNHNLLDEDTVTHWMPLPEAPKGE